MTINERASAVRGIRERIAAFVDGQFGPSVTEILNDGVRSYPPPTLTPRRGVHPRLLFTREEIPAIREALLDPECHKASDRFYQLIDSPTDGTLGPAYLHELGRKGDHNFDGEVCEAIEARALAYHLTGEEYYGYLAILSILNFLTTLDIKWIPSDQCREFGRSLFTVALVYDWCYDLLEEEDKHRLVLGAEHILCRGTSEVPAKAPPHGVKMEVGFPPANNGCVSGHGSEMQLLRDYLAIGLAIYDEHPGWWNYIGARYEYEYVPVREVFYEAGMYPQGMCLYGPIRYMCDLWSAWLVKSACGRLPFTAENMKRVVRSMLANETVDGNQFLSGDSIAWRLSQEVGSCAFASSHLFNDATARAAALYLGTNFTPTWFLIAASGSLKTAQDRHADLPMINENRGYLNQYIIRNGWEKDAASILIKGGGRYPANHEHMNAGSFQIWYKGELTGDMGLYCGYGSVHHSFYHIASVAHNTLLLYNPSMHDAELQYDEKGREINRARYWYSGGQRRTAEAPNLTAWMQDEYVTSNGTVMQSETKDGAACYAYLSSDITPAYDAETASFVKRSMLASYETDGSTPFVFFIFDRMETVDPSFKKTFLLQIPGEEAPTIEGNTVSFCRSGAKLSLTSILDSEIEGLGGIGRNHLINGVQCATPPGRMVSSAWGRIEITPPATDDPAHLFNVITVGDEDDAPVKVSAICGEGMTGAYAAGVAAVFRLGREASDAPLSFVLPADARVYLTGLSVGSYSVTAGDGTVTEITVAETADMAPVSLPAGQVTVKKNA